MRAPTASAVTKRTPVIDSVASLVRISIIRIRNIPKKRNTTPPHSGVKLNTIPNAIPGSATWESASDKRVILRRVSSEPTRPLAAAMTIPEINTISGIVIDYK